MQILTAKRAWAVAYDPQYFLQMAKNTTPTAYSS